MDTNLLSKVLAPVTRRIQLMVGRAVVRLVDDSLKLQSLQISALKDETRDGVERFQEYGFTSVPRSGAEAIFVCIGGSRAHPIVIAVEERAVRPKALQSGDVALYRAVEGVMALLKENGFLELGPQQGGGFDLVALSTPTKSEISKLRDTVDALVTKFNAHTHLGTDSVGGAVSLAAPASPATAPAAVGEIKATKVKAK